MQNVSLHFREIHVAMPQHLPALVFACLGVALSSTASAALLQGPSYIKASTGVPICEFSTCQGIGADIDEIADGNTGDNNGFAGYSGSLGTIKLDLLGNFNLTSFLLWNDVVVYAEGVRSFQLDFFDAANQLIRSSSVLAADSPADAGSPAEVYAFEAVNDVSRVDMWVQGVSGRIEIREVAFNGEPARQGNAVPEPTALALVAAGLLAGAAARRRRR